MTTSLDGLKVCIVTMYYRPEQSGCGPYTGDTAEHLAAAGADVVVVTGPPHYPTWEILPGYRNAWSRRTEAGVKVVRSPVFVPNDPTVLRRGLYEATHYSLSAPRVLGTGADVYIGATPSLSSAVLAGQVARLRKRPLLQLVQDLVSTGVVQAGLTEGTDLATRVLSKGERWALRAADAITVPGVGFLPTIEGFGVARDAVHVIPNWTRWPGLPAAAEPVLPAPKDRFTVLHTGNVGYKQALDLFAPTLELAARERPDVLFHFVGDGNQFDKFAESVRGLPNVQLSPPVSHEDYPALLLTADVFLVHERATVQDMSLPSKLTSYFAAGRPVIAVTRPGGATSAEVNRSGAGVIAGQEDPGGFIAALDELRASAPRRAELGANGIRYSREQLQPSRQLDVVADLVAGLAGRVREPLPTAP